jgi:hypothetical protein
MNIYYVYLYLDPISEVPFYVGYGHGNRSLFHLNEAISNPIPKKGQHKLNKIRKILRTGNQPKIVIVKDNLSKEQACLLEEILIAAIGREDLGLGPLTNKTRGGDGCRDWSPALKKSLSLLRQNVIAVKDPKTGEKFRVKDNDERWKNGQLVGQNSGIKFKNSDKLKGLIQAKDPVTGEIFRIHKTDPRWIEGKLVGIMRGVPSHPNTIYANKMRKGIPKTKEHLDKIGDSMRKLKWYCNFETGKVGRFRESEQPSGYIRVSGPHKRQPI